MSVHPVDHILRIQGQLRSDQTTVGNVTVKVRVNGGAATTYTNVSSPAVVQLADCTFAYAVEIPASTYADGDRVEAVFLYSAAAQASDSTVIGPTAAGSAPSAAVIADAVWDEVSADHVTVGSTGKLLSTAGGAADPLLSAVPGGYLAGTAGYILGHVIPGQDASIASPLALDLELTLVDGDDYNASDSRGIDFNEPNASWPVLTGATVKLGYQEIVNGQLTGTVTELTMSVVTATGSAKVVRLELTAAQSAAFSPGVKRYEFDVQATLQTSARKVTLARGFVTVLPSFVA